MGEHGGNLCDTTNAAVVVISCILMYTRKCC